MRGPATTTASARTMSEGVRATCSMNVRNGGSAPTDRRSGKAKVGIRKGSQAAADGRQGAKLPAVEQLGDGWPAGKDATVQRPFCIDYSRHPGTQFQNRFLEDYRCPIVRPLATSTPSASLWVAQTNKPSLVPTGLVVKALDFHFCAPPETFSVHADLPFVFRTSVANDIVKFHLLKIGVFAIDGTIFHFHPDRHSAVRDVISSASGNSTAHEFKFQICSRTWAQQWPNPTNAHLPDIGSAQLDSTAGSRVLSLSHGGVGAGSSDMKVNKTFSEHALAPTLKPLACLLSLRCRL